MCDGLLHVSLGEIVSFEYGSALPTGLRTGSEYPVFGSSGIIGYHSVPDVDGPAIIIGRKGTVGSVYWSQQPCWPIDTTYWVKPTRELDVRWLYWMLQTLGLEGMGSSTGIPGLNRNDAYRATVRLPPLPKQRRTAEILDGVDNQIRSQERTIAKLELGKRGFLDHELNKLGKGEWIPTKRLLAHVIDFRGRTPRKLGMNWGDGTILALSANNVQMGTIDTSRETYYGSERLYSAWMTHGPTRRGDIVVTMEAPLGNIARIPDDRKYILSQRVVLLRFDEKYLVNNFAYWFMRSSSFQREIAARSTGTTATGIRRATLEAIPMPVPAMSVQGKIASGVFSFQDRIDRETTVWTKLTVQKQALMDDLLTGRVRVPVGGGV